jgi:hypothetical protein
MRLNLGCGGRKFSDWVNVDKYSACGPDQVADLEQFPWPWPDNSVEEVRMYHVLEHLGRDTAVYLDIIKELYRVCRDGARINIVVPHPRHDDFLGDPTHVRPITTDNINLFSQAKNREWAATGAANTPLGLYLGVDFTIETASLDLAEPWNELFEQKKVSPADLNHAIRSYNNVVRQIHITVQAIKPAGRTSAPDTTATQPAERADQPAGSKAKLEPLRTT